ncbi:diaminobutyrate--2-oxoglutarate transaminase [Noviherbaspirillum galbum]|uniref:Diaminobutyrate--2-oxoglutarate transaminase family protein n=1 Tax=Noviherbaspirillum galbum TaxID=2709383 RepID=A0A6B3SJM9_9BURK|nr:diaminobutyrate--2-oxoglutarate transaminase [Noviherbaspirillum galbum]NEX60943.1 diaminobutyrate--2-oxoglutarate transaminase family protein [Noviherbaspirillum galbum]
MLVEKELFAVTGNAGYAARQDARESNARTYARRLRMAIAHAKGVRVTDADGKTYLDCLAAAGTLALGHNHPAVKAALIQALEQEVPFQTLDIATPLKDEFTNEIFATLPPEFAARARIQFCGPSGSDAIEAALKLVKTATQKQNVIAFSGGYHGMSQSAMGLMGNLGPKHGMAGTAQNAQFMPFPYSYRCPFGVGGEASSRMSAHYLRSLLSDVEGGVLPAGVVTELVQGEGGVIPAPNDWARAVREITRERGVPLIVDEIQTGGGRTGAFYAFEHSGIVPDVLALSKAIGGGLPMAVIIYDKDLDVWQPGAHAGTFRGNTLAMAAGVATLRTIREQNLVANAEAMGKRLESHLLSLQKDCPLIGNVRGRGLMMGAEIVDPDGKLDSLGHPPADGVMSRRIQQACLKRGLIIEMGGRHGAVARFLPPLIINADEIDAVASIFADACMESMKQAA